MKNTSKKSKSIRLGILALIVLGLFLAINPEKTKAAIHATAAFYTWDRKSGQFENGNVELWLDPNWWVPMIHEIGNDNVQTPDACGQGTSTDWAGELTMGLGHIDTPPTGGAGFQQSRNWTLVQCDRNGDGNFNVTDLRWPLDESLPLYGFVEWSGVTTDTFRTVTMDEVQTCSTGNCAYELITTMFINLDSDCDGSLSDENIPAGGICFYAEAQTPSSSDPYWEGNLQARISAGGGDKTVNHSLAGPNAVSLVNFSAQSQGSHWLLLFAGFIFLGGFIVVLLVHKKVKCSHATQEDY